MSILNFWRKRPTKTPPTASVNSSPTKPDRDKLIGCNLS